jgi:DNA-binding transcriptional LysR family regulator
MELRHLRYFRAVGEEEHFGRTAKRLNVAQPALSRQIRDLELGLNLKLFERLPKGVRLTDAGRNLLGDTQHILELVERMFDRARSVERGTVGKLKLGFSLSSSWTSALPRIIQKFRERYANVDLELAILGGPEQRSAVLERQIDAGLFYKFDDDVPELAKIAVDVSQIVLAVPAGHRLARRTAVNLADLKDEPFVWLNREANPVYYDKLLRACLSNDLSPGIVQEVVDQAMALSFIGTGDRIGFVTSHVAARCPETIAIRPLADFSLPFTLNLLWRTDNASPPLARFIELVRAHLSDARTGSR